MKLEKLKPLTDNYLGGTNRRAGKKPHTGGFPEITAGTGCSWRQSDHDPDNRNFF